MKYLKFKLFFWSIFALTAFLTSCEKDSIVPEESNIEQVHKETLKIFIPADVAVQDEKAINEFLNNSSFSDIQKFQKDAIILDFLESHDLVDLVYAENPEIQSLSDLELDKYLSNDEVEGLNQQLTTFSELQLRDPCFLTVIDEICIAYPTAICFNNWIIPYPCMWRTFCTDEIRIVIGDCP